MSNDKRPFHGRFSLRGHGPQKCKLCGKVRPKTIKLGETFYCEACWRKEIKP